MYLLKYSATICWAPDGAGSETVPTSQSMQQSDEGGVNVTTAPGFILVPGGNAPSSGNITTALNSAATALAASFEGATNLAIIQAWATGGN